MSGAVGEVIQEVRTRVRTGGISPHEEVIELRHMVEDILAQSTNAASDNESPQILVEQFAVRSVTVSGTAVTVIVEAKPRAAFGYLMPISSPVVVSASKAINKVR